MEVRRAEHTNRTRVRGRYVTDVRDEPVARVESVEAAHHSIPDDLRHDRGGGDGGASSVALDERAMRRCGWPETEAVDEACVCRRMKIGEHCSKRSQIRAMKTGAVDLGSGDHANADLRRAADDRVEELLALIVTDLLRVVQRRQRPDAGAA